MPGDALLRPTPHPPFAAQAPRSKIVKKDGAVPSAIETRVATELETIAANNAALKTDLKNLYISSAREIEVDGGRKAIVVVVPFPLLADFKKIQKLLVEELEKKLGVGALIQARRPRSRMPIASFVFAGLDCADYCQQDTRVRWRVATWLSDDWRAAPLAHAPARAVRLARRHRLPI